MLIELMMLYMLAGCQNGKTGAASVPPVSKTQDSATEGGRGVFVGSILGSVPDFRVLEKDASLIVKGHVLDVRTIGTTEMRGQKTPELAASIEVDSVLKGKVDGGTIAIRHPRDPFPGGIQLVQGKDALYFLKDSQDGAYTFVDPLTAKMDITSRKIPLASTARPPIEKLKAELFASLSDPAPDVAKTALEQVDLLGRASSAEALQRIAASRDPENEGMAYAGLIHLRNYSLLRQAIRFAEAPTTDPNIQYWESRIAASIGVIGDNRIRQALEATKYMQKVTCASTILAKQPLDRSVLPQLYPLLSSPNVELRRGAAHALRGICDSSSIPVLAQALNDSDRTVQYDAMMGLAALENFQLGLPAPAEDIFIENPTKYLDGWKSWWETAGKQKYNESQ
jgi:HEAT repeats